MATPSTVQTNGVAALAAARTQHGFLTAEQVRAVAADPNTRLHGLLVRCGGCRFTAPAQDIAHLIAIIEASGQDYVRDVSLPATDRPAVATEIRESFARLHRHQRPLTRDEREQRDEDDLNARVEATVENFRQNYRTPEPLPTVLRINGARNCGECLMSHVEIVALREDGCCPRCGADYGRA